MKGEDFIKLIDDLVEMGEFDQELKEGLQWIDQTDQVEGENFYAKCFNVLYKHEQNQRVKKFVKDHVYKE